MHLIQCKENNEYNTMHRVHCIEYNAYNIQITIAARRNLTIIKSKDPLEPLDTTWWEYGP